LLSRSGRGGAAIEWWSKLERMRPLTLEDRRDYLAAALSANEIGLAEQQVRQMAASREKTEPIDYLLAGQLAVLRGDTDEALADAAKASQLPAATPHDLLTANLLILAASPRDSARYVEACSHLVSIARGVPNEVSLEALVILAKQLAARPPGADGNKVLSIPLPELSTENMPAVEIAKRLEKHPDARAYQKMLALEMRARAEPDTESALIEKAMASYGREDDQTAAALGAWLYARGHFDAVLNLLPIERASRTRELLVERIDALAGLKRFDELKEMLLTEYPVLPQAFQHMYLAVVYADLGMATPSNDEWQRALDAADNVDRLLALADFAQKNKRFEIVDEALGRATVKQPGLRSAFVRRLRVLELIGPTAKAHDLTLDMLSLWPNDPETHMHEIYLRLLLGNANAALAEQEAERLSRKLPSSALSKSTVALARLKAGHPASALEALGGADINIPPANVSWPVYAATLAANGWREKARVEAEKLVTTPMLPEERTLIAPLLGETGAAR
jgi:tetratricopeptide (TPR) repeat protein